MSGNIIRTHLIRKATHPSVSLILSFPFSLRTLLQPLSPSYYECSFTSAKRKAKAQTPFFQFLFPPSIHSFPHDTSTISRYFSSSSSLLIPLSSDFCSQPSFGTMIKGIHIAKFSGPWFSFSFYWYVLLPLTPLTAFSFSNSPTISELHCFPFSLLVCSHNPMTFKSWHCSSDSS